MQPLDRLKKLNTTDCLWIYVLRILRDEPMHAYQIRNEITKRYGFKPGNVTSYKVFYLLNRSGLVKKREEGRRVVYEITDKGLKELKDAADFYKKTNELLSR